MPYANTLRRTLIRRLNTGDARQVQDYLRHADDAMPGNPKKLQRQFDIAFGRLYPGFNKKVNDLLRPEFAITLPENELMNTELRLLALLRVRITDCQRMATILGISVNTVYFYRNRLKNRARCRRTFEDDVMCIQSL